MFDQTRLIPIATKQDKFVAMIILEDDTGIGVIGHSIVQHLKLIGVIDQCEDVTLVRNQNTLLVFVQKPVFDVKGHLEGN